MIIGASGSFGSELVKLYDKKDLVMTYNTNYIKKGIKFNVIKDEIEKKISLLPNIKEGFVLFAEKNPNICFKKKKYTNLLNVEAVKKILNSFKKFNIKPIFLSTDLVFSGAKGEYVEKDKPNPKTLYGKQKYSVEKFIKKKFRNYLIFRLSKTYSFKKKESFSDWLNSFEKKKHIYCASDQIYNPIFIKDAARIVYEITKKNLNGIFNLAGYESYSRYEIMQKLYKEYLKIKNKKIKLIKCKFNSLGKNYENWPLNTTMNMQKVKKNINFKPMDINQAIRHTIKVY